MSQMVFMFSDSSAMPLNLVKLQRINFVNHCYPCMSNLLSLGAKMCIWNLTEGRSRNCDFKCKLGTYICGFGLYSCNAILHAMCFQFCLHRDIHKKCIPILI